MHECGEKMSIHCPLGHKHVPGGESEADKIRRQLAAERARHDQTRAALGQAERCLIAEKGAKTKLKKRIANGMCPCCKRSFQNLGRHMKTQHPQYTRDADA